MAKRQRRKGATETFSVSVDRETKRLLKEAADRDHGGNVSSLITELAKDVARRKAAGEFLRSIGVARMTAAEAAAFESEIESELLATNEKPRKPGRKTRAA